MRLTGGQISAVRSLKYFKNMRATTSLIVCVLALAACLQGVSCAGLYDPCASQPELAKGDGFTIGLAYYPGGALSDWGTLNPCKTADRTNLTAAGVASMTFRPKLDDMTFFRGSEAEETEVLASVAGADIMTVVAYAGGVRSEPRIVRATSSSAVVGGIQPGRVNSLTLVARFDEGRLQYLQWHDLGCGSCARGDLCIEVGGGYTSCAGSETDCGCTGDNCALDLTGSDVLRCQLTLATAMSGTDKHSVPLGSASQIARLGHYSVSGAAGGAGAGALGLARSALG